MRRTFMISLTLLAAAICGCASSKRTPLVPQIDGEPWTISRQPDLGNLTGPRQQPVDFGVWQARDGTWQLWSCIRGTQCGGKTRLLYRWEGRSLTAPDWTPMGIAMQADPARGETPGGLQAPYVFAADASRDSLFSRDPEGSARRSYYLAYGDWVNICLALSEDGKAFERWLYRETAYEHRKDITHRLRRPWTGMFSEGPDAGARDPMVIRIGDRWHCYYTAFPGRVGSVYCRTSRDLRKWSDSTIVARGGCAGSGPVSAECPFVVYREGYYYLFRTQHYGPNAVSRVYRSDDPMNFGIDDDRCFISELPIAAPEIIRDQGRDFIAWLLPSLDGIQMARLTWRQDS